MKSLLNLNRSLLLFAVIGASPSFAFAATGAGADVGAAETTVRIPRSNETLGPGDSASTVKAPISVIEQRKKNGFDELSVSVGNENYLSRKSAPTAASSYTEISARVRGKTEGPLFSAAIDAGASVATDVSNYSNIEVPEAYFKLAPSLNSDGKTSIKKFAQLSVGRKKERWSGLDSDWSLGLVQPFNKFDALRPTEQGLTGAFGEAGLGPVSVMLFGSPFFIPEQGAPYQLADGKFSTSSPWFSSPPNSLIFSNQTRPVYYNIQLPETSNVVNHSSFGARARIADSSGDGFYAQGSFLRAPMNSISLSFFGDLAIRDGATYGDVTVVPEVVYHTMTASDVGYDSKNFAVEMALLNEVPDQPTLAPHITTSHYNPMLMLSPSVELRTFTSKVWGPRFRVSYLDTHGGDVQSIGEYASNGNVFGPRTMYQRAVSGSVETTLHRSSSWSLETSARWVEEVAENGSIVMTDVRVGIGDSWRVSLQGDLIGSQKATSVTDTFIERFRANNRVAGRVTYLF